MIFTGAPAFELTQHRPTIYGPAVQLASWVLERVSMRAERTRPLRPRSPRKQPQFVDCFCPTPHRYDRGLLAAAFAEFSAQPQAGQGSFVLAAPNSSPRAPHPDGRILDVTIVII